MLIKLIVCFAAVAYYKPLISLTCPEYLLCLTLLFSQLR